MDIVLRSALMYLVTLILLRVTTRRLMRSATPLDFALIFLFGGLAVQCVIGDDRSITGSLLAMSTVAGLHVGLSRLKLIWPVVGKITEGTSVVIYANGRWDDREMQRLRVHRNDVMAEVRYKGMNSLEAVASAIVEHNGGISLIRKEEKPEDES
jgi:uncharacterized membrane protein YcaP (DUF421 family)